ncbi:MAG: hypothetical protein GC204_13695 [Chloroflexi bacterium]|nr:hypothetical protein [Chloroflexota bacterium]
MTIQTFNTSDAQRQLAHLIANVSQENGQVRITAGNEAQARLVSERFMLALDDLLEEDSALSDTLALMMNEEIQSILETGREEIAKGNKIPLDD